MDGGSETTNRLDGSNDGNLVQAHVINGDVNIHAARRARWVVAVAVGTVVLVAVAAFVVIRVVPGPDAGPETRQAAQQTSSTSPAVVTPTSPTSPSSSSRAAAVSSTARPVPAAPPAVRFHGGFGGCRSVYFNKTLSEVKGLTSATAYADGVVEPNGREQLAITVQTPAAEDVILTSLTVHVTRRSLPPHSGVTVAPYCGSSPAGPLQVGDFQINLDADPVQVAAVSPNPWGSAPSRFPFKVGPNDPVDFQFGIADTTCDCEFTVAVDWVEDGRAGQTVVADTNGPFHVVPSGNYPVYQPDQG